MTAWDLHVGAEVDILGRMTTLQGFRDYSVMVRFRSGFHRPPAQRDVPKKDHGLKSAAATILDARRFIYVLDRGARTYTCLLTTACGPQSGSLLHRKQPANEAAVFANHCRVEQILGELLNRVLCFTESEFLLPKGPKMPRHVQSGRNQIRF